MKRAMLVDVEESHYSINTPEDISYKIKQALDDEFKGKTVLITIEEVNSIPIN